MDAPERGDDPIDTAWARVIDAWDDDDAHRAFVALATSTDRLAEAGRRYREVAETDPERAARARQQIDRVIAAAVQGLATLKTEPSGPSAKTKLLLIAIGMSGAMVASVVWVLLRWL